MSASAVVATPKKATKVSKGDKKAPSHPTYSAMIKAAVKNLKDRQGSSKQAIFKYILANYKVGSNSALINSHLRQALKNGVSKGLFTQPKGTGASGRFRLSESAKAKAAVTKTTKPKTKKAVKPAEKKASPKKKAPKAKSTKAKSPKKAATKAPKVAKKAKSPKKVKATKPKSPKKAAKAKVAKKAAPAPTA